MPNYRWTCQVCQVGNSEKTSKCKNCNHAAETTVWEIDARTFALTKMLGGINSFSCPECLNKLHEVSFSEDPVHYFQERGGRPLLRTITIITRCEKCNHKIEKEFYVPIIRRIYRKLTRKDITNVRLKKI